jgi:hypothetical protein
VSNNPIVQGRFTGRVQALVNLATLRGVLRDDLQIGLPGASEPGVRATAYAVVDGSMPAVRPVAAGRVTGGGMAVANVSVIHEQLTIPILVDALRESAGLPPIGLRNPAVVRIGRGQVPTMVRSGLIQSRTCLDESSL